MSIVLAANLTSERGQDFVALIATSMFHLQPIDREYATATIVPIACGHGIWIYIELATDPANARPGWSRRA